MKLRQNKNGEIDLRTIADEELGNQISSMLPNIDASMKFLGRIQAGTTILFAKAGYMESANPTNLDIPLGFNGYGVVTCKKSLTYHEYHLISQGKTWERFKQYDGQYDTGWIEILNEKTGVKKSGDIMTGNFAVEGNHNPLIAATAKEYNRSTILQVDGAAKVSYLYNMRDWGNFSRIKLKDENWPIADVVSISKVVNGSPYEYRLYGEHNPPHVIGGYTGDGSGRRLIVVGFYPLCVIIIKNGVEVMSSRDHGSGTDNGFFVESTLESNTSGSSYQYIVFK